MHMHYMHNHIVSLKFEFVCIRFDYRQVIKTLNHCIMYTSGIRYTALAIYIQCLYISIFNVYTKYMYMYVHV